MRCPKCHYLSFDPEPRCRNCGYDLEVTDTELALRTAEPADAPVPDLTLRERPAAPAAPVTLELVHSEPGPEETAPDYTAPDYAPDYDAPDYAAPDYAALEDTAPDHTPPAPRLTLVEDAGHRDGVAIPAAALAEPVVLPAVETRAVEPAPEPPRAPFRAPNTTAELPLFVKGIADHEAFPDEEVPVQVAPPPLPPTRPPLAVRRAVSEPPRARPNLGSRRLGPLDHDLLEDLKRVEREEAARAREELRPAAALMDGGERVEPLRRAGAAAVDAAVLGSIAAFVFWATLRLCAVNLSDLGTAALVPLFAFIAAMDLAYLLMFTAAGGQTVGKMLMGIRVVGDGTEDDEPVPLRRAAWRAALTIISVIGLGLGWLPALFGRGLTLHDRLAHTRVVRA